MNKKQRIIGILLLVTLFIVGFVSVQANQRSVINQEIDSGNKYLSEGRYEEAIISFNKVIEIDKKNVPARVGVSKAYVALERFDEAENVLNEGIDLVPKEEKLYAALVDVYLVEDKIEEAIRTLDEGYSKTKNKDLKDRLDKISEEINIVVAINPLQVKNKTEVKLVKKDSSGNEKELELDAEWLTQDNLGKVEKGEKTLYTAIEEGNAKIVAKIGSIEKETTVEIKETVIESIDIVSLTTNSTVGDIVEFKAIVKDQLGNIVDIEPTWDIEGDIAQMATNQGLLNTLEYIKDGQGRVTVSIGDIKSTVDVTIEKRKFNIITIVSGVGSVSRTPDSDIYIDGDKVVLTANPSEGWSFKGWEGELRSSKNPLEITMDSDKIIKAVFEPNTFTLNTSVIGNGSISRDVNLQKYEYGSAITLSAIPQDGWIFDHWEGDVSGENSQSTISINSDKNVVAVFTKKKYNIEVTTSGEGEVEKIESGINTFKLTAKPRDGWTFERWEGDITGNTNPVVTTINGNKNVKAVFVQKEFNLNIESEGMGSVNKFTRNGTDFELTAIPSEGWEFKGWSGIYNGEENPINLKIDKNESIKAIFEKKEYKLNFKVNGQGNVLLDNNKEFYEYGEEVRFTVTPNDGYIFNGFTGDLTGNENPAVLYMNSDKYVEVNFSRICISGKIVNGKTGYPLDGAIINVKNSSGDTLRTETTNLDGEYIILDLQNGEYYLEILKDGFIMNREAIFVGDSITIKNSSLMPSISDDVYRFRLSWGEEPRDLDLHLIDGNGEEIYYGNRNSLNDDMVLDTDLTSGFGPETITINKQNPGKYRLFVYNYSYYSSSFDNSNAKIEVFKGNDLIKTINISPDNEGRYWNVLELEGDEITEINTISNEKY